MLKTDVLLQTDSKTADYAGITSFLKLNLGNIYFLMLDVKELAQNNPF